MTRGTLTGKHMAAIFIAFFGTIIAVNLTMAMFASGTFGGTVVDNSYVASQKFNGWLEQARQGETLGWDVSYDRHNGELMLSVLGEGGDPIGGLNISGSKRHPVGVADPHPVVFTEVAPGRYAGRVGSGRWQVRLAMTRGDAERRIQIDLP